MKNRTQALAFERAEEGFARHLLPPRASLFVAHDEVLVVDARQIKVELAPAYCCFPHHAGVAERSISSDYRNASDHVLYEMVISHQAHGIRDGFSLKDSATFRKHKNFTRTF